MPSHRSRLPLAVLVPLAPLALAGSLQDPTYAPEDGAGWERTLEERTTWLLEDAQMAVNDEPMSFDLPDIRSTMLRRVVAATEVAVADGAVRGEERTFATAEGSFEMEFALPGMDLVYEFDLASPLAGETVAFAPDEDGAFRPSWPGDSERDATLLERLHWASDLQACLPGEAVEEDDSWELDPDTVGRLLAPFGDLHFQPDGDTGGDDTVPAGSLIGAGLLAIGELRDEPLDGAATATWKGAEERDGRRLGRIAIELEGTFELERDDQFQALIEAMDAPDGDCSLRYVLELEAEGLVTWDLDANRPAGCTWAIELLAEADLSWPEDVNGVVSQFETNFEISGETELVLAIEE